MLEIDEKQVKFFLIFFREDHVPERRKSNANGHVGHKVQKKIKP